MSENSEYFGIFDTKVDDMTSFEEEEKKDYSKIFFEPNPTDDGKPFIALIKFLPNIYAPTDDFPKRFYYKLPNADRQGRNWHWVSPTTVGENCPVVDAWFANKDSEDPIKKSAAASLKRSRQRGCVIQILKCKSMPELEGQLRIFRFQYDGDIDKLILSKIKPSDEEIEMGKVPEKVTNPFYSSLMILKVEKGEYGRDFGGSEWADSDKKCGMKIGDKMLNQKDASNADIQKQIIELLKSENISLKDHFMYSPPTEESIKNVNKSLNLLFSGAYTPASNAENTEEQNDTSNESTTAVNNPGKNTSDVEEKNKLNTEENNSKDADDMLADMGFAQE